MHGGAAPQVRRAAQVRLLMAADRVMGELLTIATDQKVPTALRLVAIRDALDRAGLQSAQEVNVNVEATFAHKVEQVVFVDDFDDADVVDAEPEPLSPTDREAMRQNQLERLSPAEQITAERAHRDAVAAARSATAKPPTLPQATPTSEPASVFDLAWDDRSADDRHADRRRAELRRDRATADAFALPEPRRDEGYGALKPLRPRRR